MKFEEIWGNLRKFVLLFNFNYVTCIQLFLYTRTVLQQERSRLLIRKLFPSDCISEFPAESRKFKRNAQLYQNYTLLNQLPRAEFTGRQRKRAWFWGKSWVISAMWISAWLIPWSRNSPHRTRSSRRICSSVWERGSLPEGRDYRAETRLLRESRVWYASMNVSVSRTYVCVRYVTSRKSMTHLHLLFLFFPLFCASPLLSFCTARIVVYSLCVRIFCRVNLW